MKVELIQASICALTKTPIFTLMLEYPRYIHSQLLTHRAFSKNSSSTRAVPLKASIQNIRENPAEYFWTYNQGGMQGKRVEDPIVIEKANNILFDDMEHSIRSSLLLGLPVAEGGLNIHKQDAGRLLEPYQNIRVCLTSTEWANWDWLRVDKAAQPAIDLLANMMRQVRELALPSAIVLQPGEWHVPFVKRVRNADGVLEYYAEDDTPLTLEQAKMVSMSSGAQTSYRKLDTTLEKADDMYAKLFSGDKVHASPSEHQATPMGQFVDYGDNNAEWLEGITHIDRKHQYWSGNFRNWIQHRQLIPNNAMFD